VRLSGATHDRCGGRGARLRRLAVRRL
jgi:hypothetical protein